MPLFWPFLKGHIHLALRQQLHANVSLINVINLVDSDAAPLVQGSYLTPVRQV